MSVLSVLAIFFKHCAFRPLAAPSFSISGLPWWTLLMLTQEPGLWFCNTWPGVWTLYVPHWHFAMAVSSFATAYPTTKVLESILNKILLDENSVLTMNQTAGGLQEPQSSGTTWQWWKGCRLTKTFAGLLSISKTITGKNNAVTIALSSNGLLEIQRLVSQTTRRCCTPILLKMKTGGYFEKTW